MKDSMLSRFFKYVSLNVLGMIGISFYILADTFFISKALGPNGLASLNFALVLYSLVSSTGLMIGIGGGTSYIIRKSRNQMKEANIALTTCVKMALIIGSVLLIAGQLFSGQFASFLGADEATHGDTSIYIKMVFSFSAFFILNHILLAFVRNDNAPKVSMIAMLSGSIMNVILDYIFLFPLKMGMFGAVFATCLAPVISICVMSVHLLSEENNLRLVKSKLKLKEIGNIISLGISSFVNEISSGIFLFTYNYVILRLRGNIGVAAYGVVANLAFIVIAIFTGIAQGIQPIASHAYGNGNKEDYRKIVKYSAITSFVLSTAIYIMSIIFTNEMISIFNSENNMELLEIANKGIKIYFIGFFFTGINIVSTSLLSSIERAKEAFAVSMLRGCIIAVPLVLILSRIIGMTGVWLAFVLSEMTVFIMIIASRRKILDFKQDKKELNYAKI